MIRKAVSVLLCSVILCTAFTLGVSASEKSTTPDFETRTDSLLLVDTATDEVVYSKNADVKRAMASTTKIMTYVVTSDAIIDPANTFMEIKSEPIEEIKGLDASVAGLENHIGESFSVLDVLYAMMVPSGCDASAELAYLLGEGDSSRLWI